MRLNVRLMGLLFGLLVIAIIARTVRLAPRGRSGKKGGGVAAIMLAALAILVIGYVGLFFGRLIQAAVSRNRESLADASAVQFTRDPSGLKGALLKIAATGVGSRIVNPEGEEVAHMLFAPGMQRMFATHPALVTRLKAIDPRFDPREIDEARAFRRGVRRGNQRTNCGGYGAARPRVGDQPARDGCESRWKVWHAAFAARAHPAKIVAQHRSSKPARIRLRARPAPESRARHRRRGARSTETIHCTTTRR